MTIRAVPCPKCRRVPETRKMEGCLGFSTECPRCGGLCAYGSTEDSSRSCWNRCVLRTGGGRMNEGFMCNDCTHFTIVEYGEGGMYAACTKNGGLVMINGQSPEKCDDFEMEVKE